MDLLVRYYLHHAGRGRADNRIGPTNSILPFLQRDHVIGSILGGLCGSFVRPFIRQGAKTMGSEALATGRNILTHIMDPKANFVTSYVGTNATRRIEN